MEDVYEEFEVEYNGEYCWRNDLTRFQFHEVVKAMGWANISEFIDETGIEYEDIKGHYWTVLGSMGGPSRVFICG